jgi:hypothetical protein
MRELLQQADELQNEEDGGTMYVGSLLHYMIGAKLRLSCDPKLVVRSASSSDTSSNTGGDYDIGDAVIHVTTQPGEPLFDKCSSNLASGLRPLVVTIPERLEVARQFAGLKEITERVEIVDAIQFMAMNLYEKAGFVAADEKPSLKDFITIYNEIVSEVDSDPSLRIKFV